MREPPTWLSGGRGNSKYEASEVGVDLACLCGCKEARVVGVGLGEGEYSSPNVIRSKDHGV